MFNIENLDFAADLNDKEWCAKVACLADIFSCLNHLNENTYARKTSKCADFQWWNQWILRNTLHLENISQKKNRRMFPLMGMLDTYGDMTSELTLIHLRNLEGSLKNTFSLYHWCYVWLYLESICCVQNSLHKCCMYSESTSDFPLEKQKQLSELKLDWALHLKYDELQLP